jgi:hypothetical protein
MDVRSIRFRRTDAGRRERRSGSGRIGRGSGRAPRPRGLRADHPSLDGTRNELRIERLAGRLRAEGPLPVESAWVRGGGHRVGLVLAGGAVLRLRLFWACKVEVTELESIRWDDRIGWVVVVRTASGPRVAYAWLASLEDDLDRRHR